MTVELVKEGDVRAIDLPVGTVFSHNGASPHLVVKGGAVSLNTFVFFAWDSTFVTPAFKNGYPEVLGKLVVK